MLIENQHKSVKDLIENLLFLAKEPLTLKRLGENLPHSKEEILAALDSLQADYQDRGLRLRFTAGGWEFTTDPALSNEIETFYNLQRRKRLSRQALETLTVIAYNQPVTRVEVETVRGVSTSGTIQTLIDCDFIKVIGQKNSLGHPYLYGTTETFLKHFGLGDVTELPPLEYEREGVKKPDLSIFRQDQTGTGECVSEDMDAANEDGEITAVDFGMIDEAAVTLQNVQQKGA